MKNPKLCYRCGKPAENREHIPPKSFFPKGGNLQLKTVPSCKKHNNDKSNDDQYLLAHICMNAGKKDNLPHKIFMRSIAPYLKKNSKFLQSLSDNSIDLPDGSRLYEVNRDRFDNFFDHLTCALYFDRYGTPLDERNYEIKHYYLNLKTSNLSESITLKLLTPMINCFYRKFEKMISMYEADKIDEIVYQNKIFDPGGKYASITIAHTFYGIFNVVLLLSKTS